MANDLVTPTELAGYPGAPFTDDETDAAADTLRSALHWHVAPEREDETIILDVARGKSRLFLPTRHIVSVTEVRALGEVVDDSLYEVSTNLNILRRKGYAFWPEGYGAVEVDLTHGHESVPLELLPVIAAIAAVSRRDQNVRQGVTGLYVLPLVGIDRIIARHDAHKLQLGFA